MASPKDNDSSGETHPPSIATDPTLDAGELATAVEPLQADATLVSESLAEGQVAEPPDLAQVLEPLELEQPIEPSELELSSVPPELEFSPTPPDVDQVPEQPDIVLGGEPMVDEPVLEEPDVARASEVAQGGEIVEPAAADEILPLPDDDSGSALAELIQEESGLCPHCQTTNVLGAKYCRSCGQAFFDESEHNASECSRCLAPLLSDDHFCSSCGLVLDQDWFLREMAGAPEAEVEVEHRPSIFRRVLGFFFMMVAWLVAIALTLSIIVGGVTAGIWFFGYAQSVDLYAEAMAPILVETNALDRDLGLNQVAKPPDLQAAQVQLDALDNGFARISEESARVSGVTTPAFLVPVTISLTQALEYRQEALTNDRSAMLATIQATQAQADASYYQQMGDWYYTEYQWTGSSRNSILDQYRYALDKEKLATDQANLWQQLAKIYEARSDEAQATYTSHMAYVQSEINRVQQRPANFDEFVRQVRIVLGI